MYPTRIEPVIRTQCGEMTITTDNPEERLKVQEKEVLYIEIGSRARVTTSPLVMENHLGEL